MTTGEAQGLLEGRMTPLDSICWTWAISSRRTAGFWRRYGWQSGGPSVSIACCRSGVQPMSSSPWLTMSLNSWKRSFSCCCWVGDRCAGTGGGRCGLEAAGEAEGRRWQRLLECLHFVRYVGGEVLGGGYGSWPILRIHWWAQVPRTQTLADPPPGKSRHLRWARGYGSGPGSLFRRGCRRLAATECGWGGGRSCVWAALRRMVCGSGCEGVAVPWVTSIRTRSRRIISIPISTGGDSRPLMTMKLALPLASLNCRLRCWVYSAIWRSLPWAPWTTPSKGFKGPHWAWYCCHTENPMQVTEVPVSTRPRTGMPSRLSWPAMGGPTAHPTGVTLASGDPSNSLTAHWGWSGSHPLEAAAPGFVLEAGRGRWPAGKWGVGGPGGQDSWIQSGLIPRRGSSVVVFDPSDGGEGGRMEAPRRNLGTCGERGRQEAIERLQRLLRLEQKQLPWRL